MLTSLRKSTILLLLTAIGTSAAATSLPEIRKPNFDVSSEVIASLDSMISYLQAAEKDAPDSWQIGRALANCTGVRSTIVQWPDVGAYNPRGAERLWKECVTTYRAVQ